MNYVQIREFLSSSRKNADLTVGALFLYVRKSTRLNPIQPIHYICCFDLARVEVAPLMQSQGIFTEFLNNLPSVLYPHIQWIYIEQVLNPRFADFFRKIPGIIETSDGVTPSFFYRITNDANIFTSP